MIAERLQQLGIVLPAAPKPLAVYIPAVRTGSLLFVSGQLPLVDGALQQTGHLGSDLTVEEGQAAARVATLNALAMANDLLGTLDLVSRVVRMVCHVASAAGFTQQHLVANGASQLLGEVFGESGRHARLALGAAELPLNAPVEVELILEVQGG
jgi:enamine deaminase RidA (YjgF/YER057c/UK114 family)